MAKSKTTCEIDPTKFGKDVLKVIKKMDSEREYQDIDGFWTGDEVELIGNELIEVYFKHCGCRK